MLRWPFCLVNKYVILLYQFLLQFDTCIGIYIVQVHLLYQLLLWCDSCKGIYILHARMTIDIISVGSPSGSVCLLCGQSVVYTCQWAHWSVSQQVVLHKHHDVHTWDGFEGNGTSNPVNVPVCTEG